MKALSSAPFASIFLSALSISALAACSASGGPDDSNGSGGAGTGGSETTGGSGGAPLGSGGQISGSGGALGSGGGASGGTSGQPVACPADAYFCTGFEEAGIPAGAAYYPADLAANWTERMTLQGTTVNAGSQALEVHGLDGYMWNLLGVPVTSSAFWARFYLRSSIEIGQDGHNSYVAAMTGNGDQNVGDNMEISEQYCQMVLNLHDAVTTSIGGTPLCGTGVPPLTADEWHCMEVHFDGPGGTVQVYADNSPVIDATGLAALDYATFGFGYLGFHGPARTLWYDDVAVGPTRPGCP